LWVQAERLVVVDAEERGVELGDVVEKPTVPAVR
jgi:hypothetical protein